MRISSGRDKGYIVAGAAVYGYASNHIDAFQKLPVIDAIGPHLTRGILLHYIAKNTSGETSKWTDLASVAALSIGGFNLGATKGDLAAAAAMKGDDDDAMLGGHGASVSGEVDGDDYDDDEVEGDDDDDEVEGDDEDDDDVEGDDDDDDDDDD